MIFKYFLLLIVTVNSLYPQKNLGFKNGLTPEVNELEVFSDTFFKTRQLNSSYILAALYKDKKSFVKSYPEHSPTFSELTKFESRVFDDVFTNLAILQLQELEKLNLRSDIYNHKIRYDRNFKQSILIENLLTHTTGLQENIIYPNSKKKRNVDFYRSLTFSRFSEPNEFIGYLSDSADLLKIIIQDTSGLEAEEFITSSSLMKLGLESTSYEDSKFLTLGKDIEKIISIYPDFDILESKGLIRKNTISESLQEKFRGEDKLPGTVIGFFEHFENGIWGYSRIDETNLSTEEFIFFPDNFSALYLYTNSNNPKIRKEFVAEYLDKFFPVKKTSIRRDKSPGYAEYLQYFEGDYSPVQISKQEISKFKLFTSSIRITQDNGVLILESDGKDSYGDLSGKMEFIETDPFLFRSPEWEIYISFKMNEEGDVEYLLSGAGNHGAYKKLSYRETKSFHKSLAFLFLGFYLLAFVFLVAEVLYTLVRKITINSNRIQRIIQACLWIETVLVFSIFAGFYYFIDSYKLLEVNEYIIEKSLYDYTIFSIPFAFIFAMSILTYYTIKGMLDKNILIYKKILSALYIAISFAFIYWMGYWNLLSYGF